MPLCNVLWRFCACSVRVRSISPCRLVPEVRLFPSLPPALFWPFARRLCPLFSPSCLSRVDPALAGWVGVCMSWKIWTVYFFCIYLSMQGGNVSIAGCPMKRAIRLYHGWYGVWSTLRTCEQTRFPWFSFSSVSVSRRRGMGLSREPHLPNISSISLSSCCGMAPAIWMGRSTLFFSLGLWSDLCCDVERIMIRFYFPDEYLGLGFMSCCFLMGFSSQQITSWSFSSLVCVCIWYTSRDITADRHSTFPRETTRRFVNSQVLSRSQLWDTAI